MSSASRMRTRQKAHRRPRRMGLSTAAAARSFWRDRRLPFVLLLSGLAVALVTLLAFGWMTQPTLGKVAPKGPVASTHPVVEVHLDHARTLTAADVTLRVDGLDIGDVQVDGGVITAKLPLAGEGRHEVHLQTAAIGLFQRSLDERWSFTVDTKLPALRLRSPRTTPTASAKRAITFSVVGEPGAQLKIRTQRGFNETTHIGDDGTAHVKVRLREGRNRVTVTTRDRAGNSTSKQQIIYVDSIKPAAQLTLATDRLVDARPVLMATASDDRGEVTVAATIDDRPVDVTGDGPYTLKLDDDLTEGRHRINVTATDRVGNTTTATKSVLLDSSETLGDNALSRGARGQDVRDLQRSLQEKGLWKREDHPREWRGMLYGPTTSAAVASFQAERGIDADGVAGKTTIAALTMKIVISQASHTLTLFQVDRVVRTYPVAVGSPTYPTPMGEWRIVRMEKNPTWIPPKSDWAKKAKPIPPGPNNPLGTRFMALDAPPGTVGIHGTPNPASLGYSVSHGCIRMAIPDVEDLFERVDVGTPVTIA